jgi:hypothetical protein
VPSPTDFNQVHDVLSKLHEAGVVNLDKSMREMLSTRDELSKLSPGGELASAVIAWDGYGLVIASEAHTVAELAAVSDRLRRISGGSI